MVKPKSQSKKSKRGGVDFTKYKRKIGRKLPPPKNATNTEIKSKTIVLPEQSIVSERAGLATSRRGLTLKELLQQTSHHNAKTRKDALHGIKDILLNNPNELELHKLSIVEKLRERIGDVDEVVRETLYQLFKSVIFPGGSKISADIYFQDNHDQIVSLMMPYVFIAMANLALDVRLAAFKFSDLVVQFYPLSFPPYAEKVLQNYEIFLKRNLVLEDKSKLKIILTGLIRCLSLLSPEETKKDDPPPVLLHAYEPTPKTKPIRLEDFATQLKNLLPIFVGCFHDFKPLLHSTSQLDLQSCDCMQLLLQCIEVIVKLWVSGMCGPEPNPLIVRFREKPVLVAEHQLLLPKILKKLWNAYPLDLVCLAPEEYRRISMLNMTITKIFLELKIWDSVPPVLLDKFLEFIESSLAEKDEKYLLPLIPYLANFILQISGDRRCRTLEAFTEVFRNSTPESSMKLACIGEIQKMLNPGDKRTLLYDCYGESDPTLLRHQISWVKDLPSLLILLDDKSPICSKAVLTLLVRVGQFCPINASLHREFDSLPFIFREFFSKPVENDLCFGPFTRLPRDTQQPAIYVLYYFSRLDYLFLKSLVSCCLCDHLEPDVIFRIFDVLQSSYRDRDIKIADYISFHITVLRRFPVYPEETINESDRKPTWKTFKGVIRAVCRQLSWLGDVTLVLQIIEKIVVDEICSDIPMDNKCAFITLILSLDSKPSKLSDESITSMSHALPQYMISVLSKYPEDDQDSMSDVKRREYYLIPPVYLICRSKKLFSLVLKVMGSWVSEAGPAGSTADRSTTMRRIASIVLLMYNDINIRRFLTVHKIEIKRLLQNMLNLLTCEGPNMTLEERHNTQRAYDQLRSIFEGESLL